MNALDLKPHGTTAAARRHYRRGEKPCEACRQTMALAAAEFRERNPGYYDAKLQAQKARYRAARQAGLSPRQASSAMSSEKRFRQLLAGAS